MSQKTTKKKREKGPKYHRWNAAKEIYEIKKPYQLEHIDGKPNMRIMPLGMKNLLIERGIWQSYLDYFQTKGLEYEVYNDMGKNAVILPETKSQQPSKLNITRKRRIKIVDKFTKDKNTEHESKPKPKDLSIPLEDDIRITIPTEPEKVEIREPEKVEESLKTKSIFATIYENLTTATPVKEPEREPDELPLKEPEREPDETPVKEPEREPDDPPVEKSMEEPKKENDETPAEEPEKEPVEDKNENTKYDFLYPTLDDPNFNIKLAKHKEFNDTKYDGKIYDFREHAEVLCNASFELMPHQIFVKNFLSNQTPYNSLLLYAALGTGKSCAAIGVAEEARAYMKQSGMSKSIFIIASPNVQDNFRLQLFDETKLTYENGIWNIRSCVGEALLNEINPTYFKNMSKERVINQVKAIINEHYVFMGYTQFANFISDSVDAKGIGYSKEEKIKIKMRKTRAVFNNRLIIIDEVHNIRITNENKNKKTAELLMQVARYANNMRILLLSATPMYNSHEEIIWLTNLMNLNDKRAPIKISEVFDKKGDFIKVGGKYNENGRDLLIRKLTGYVSYVRGENPYSFPFRVYPEKTGFNTSDNPYPKYQMNGNMIDTNLILKHVPVYLNNIGDFQKDAYQFVVNHTFQREHDSTETSPSEESSVESTETSPSEESSVESTETSPSEESSIESTETSPSEESSVESTETSPSEESSGESTKIPKNNKIVKGGDNDIETAIKMDTYRYTQLQRPLEALNIAYPTKKIYQTSIPSEEKDLIITEMLGAEGLGKMISYKEHIKDYNLKYNYEYKTTEYGRIFSPENIRKYSAKIANICDIIKQSEGVILIYSQWIDGGIVPMALALEEMGFSRYGTEKYTKSLFKTPPTEPIDSLTMNPRKSGEPTTFKPAKYMIITGESAFSPNNSEDIKYLNNPKNKYGEYVKVVLISKAAAEGIDFKNIRQIHVMEPWFNMNRIEQIIGRGVRNLSHCGLPFEKRNVEIYLHATILDNKTESTDLYIYRLAEQKSIKIGNVSRILKETAVDCILNIAQTNFTAENIAKFSKNNVIQIQTATGKMLDYTVGDKPFTEMCDYKDNCNFTCSPKLPDGQTEIPKDEIIKSTYNESFLQSNRERIMKRIRELFKDIPGQHMGRVFYHIDELIASVNIVKEYPIEQIYNALTHFIENQNEYLIDRYGRKGYLINHGKYYIFQPIEITDMNASIYERSNPVDYKHHSIMVDLPSKLINNVEQFIDNSVKKDKTMDLNPEKDDENREPDKFNEIYVRLSENYKLAFIGSGSQKFISGEKNWYKNIYVILEHLIQKHNIERDELEILVIQHIIDEIPFSEKLILLNKIYDNNRSWKPKDEFDTKIKEYFDQQMLVSERGIIGIVLSSDNKTTKIYIQSREPADIGIWKPAEFTDSNSIIRSPDYSKKNIYNKQNLNQIIGFMSWVDSHNEYVFKIRDVTDSVNKRGARVGQASAKDIIIKINAILGEQFYTMENIKEFFGEGKNRLFVIIEILMRHFQNIHKNNKIWVLTNEQVLINGILQWSRQ